jgi:type IV secretion system protein VirB9
MKTALYITAAALLLSAQALAVEQPKAGKHDGRIRYINYNPDQVIQIWTAPGGIMEIQFSEGESVPEGNVAATDGSRLLRTPRGNFLYLKAKGCLDPEPLLVTTKTASGQLRPYRFEVSTRGSDCAEPTISTQPNPALSLATSAQAAAPKPPHHGNLKYVPEGGLSSTADVMYAVVIRYPDDEAAKRAALARKRALEQQRQEANLLLKQQTSWPYGNQFDGSWNFKYAAHGSLTVPPRQIRDNGYQTVFLFPQMQRVPALFRLQPGATRCNREHDDHNEGTQIPSVHRSGADGDTIIAEGTAQGWCLRDGNTVLEIVNFAYNPAGATPATGTVSPYVKRTLKDDPEPEEQAPIQAPIPLQPEQGAAPPKQGSGGPPPEKETFMVQPNNVQQGE